MQMRNFFSILLLLCFFIVKTQAQQPAIDSIFFNLYTDSLKKNAHNYINVDGKTSEGRWMPLTNKHLNFTCNYGKFEGNDLILDSAKGIEKIFIKVSLISNPAVYREVTIYVKQKPFTERLKTNEEVLQEIQRAPRRKRN
jgi:hypothetical protein